MGIFELPGGIWMALWRLLMGEDERDGGWVLQASCFPWLPVVVDGCLSDKSVNLSTFRRI